jgi:endoglucanase
VTGSATGSGGTSVTGGATGTRVTTVTSSATGAGGTIVTSSATGSGAGSVTGGATGTGVISVTGGATGSGGTSGTGSATGSGGTRVTGGATSSGGTSRTGGATGSGGITGFSGTGANSFVVQAEDFISCVDLTPNNADLIYRTDVDADITYDHDPFYYEGIRVHNIETGESLTYSINVPVTDVWNITFNGLLNFDLYFDNALYASNLGVPVDFNVTDFRANQNLLVSGVSLAAGPHTMTIVANNGVNDYNDMQLDYVWFASATRPPAALAAPVKPYNDAAPPARPAGYVSPVERYGNLSVSGTGLRAGNTNANVRLRGIALHSSKWFPTIPNNTIYNLAYQENVQLIRLAMYAEYGTYDDPDLQEYLKAKTLEVINEAIGAGIYLEISYHTHQTDFSLGGSAYALEKAFYQWLLTQPVVAAKPPNLLFGIINEIASSTMTWAQVKPYAQDFVNLIRATQPDNVISCGTPYWCQHPQDVVGNELSGGNVVYTFHMYTATHPISIANNLVTAYNAGLPIWANEISPGAYDWTNWQYNFTDFDTLVSTLESRTLGWVNWNFSVKGEALAALQWNSQYYGPWQAADFTEGGLYMRGKLASP